MMINNSEKQLKIFIDFDGTISTTDIGEYMFIRFSDGSKNRKEIERWENGEMTSPELWKIMCSNTKDFNEIEFGKFLKTVELDEAFIKFVDFCNERGYEIFILSDGFDYYISRVLESKGLHNLKFFSNKLKVEDGNLYPEFVHTDEECNLCGNCKRNHVLDLSSDDEYTVYIGDGNSDKCPVQFVDYIFAKNSLLKFCEKNRISYYPYHNFHNIINILKDFDRKKKFKKRHQAYLKRREIYLQG